MGRTYETAAVGDEHVKVNLDQGMERTSHNCPAPPFAAVAPYTTPERLKFSEAKLRIIHVDMRTVRRVDSLFKRLHRIAARGLKHSVGPGDHIVPRQRILLFLILKAAADSRRQLAMMDAAE